MGFQERPIESRTHTLNSVVETYEINEEVLEPLVGEPMVITEVPETTPVYFTYYTEQDVINMAKILYTECGGVPSDTEKACVAWTVCNRANASGMTITDVITQKNQFAFRDNTPVTESLYSLASDVLNRWNKEKNGEINVGRVLPEEYKYFHGDGKHNYFRNRFNGDFLVWDYSLPTPYES